MMLKVIDGYICILLGVVFVGVIGVFIVEEYCMWVV